MNLSDYRSISAVVPNGDHLMIGAAPTRLNRTPETIPVSVEPYSLTPDDRGHFATGHIGDFKYVVHRPKDTDRFTIQLKPKDGSISHPSPSYQNVRTLLDAHKAKRSDRKLEEMHSRYKPVKLSRSDPYDAIHTSPKSPRRRLAKRIVEWLQANPDKKHEDVHRHFVPNSTLASSPAFHALMAEMVQKGLVSQNVQDQYRSNVQKPHDDHQNFIDAIRANPKDHLTSLVYADFLDEHEHPEVAKAIRASVEHMGGLKYKKGNGKWGVEWPLKINLGDHALVPAVSLEQAMRGLRLLHEKHGRTYKEDKSRWEPNAKMALAIAHHLHFSPHLTDKEMSGKIIDGIQTGKGLTTNTHRDDRFHWARQGPAYTIENPRPRHFDDFETRRHAGPEVLHVMDHSSNYPRPTLLSRPIASPSTLLINLNGQRVGTVILPASGPPSFFGGAQFLFSTIPSYLLDSGNGMYTVPGLGVITIQRLA